MIAIGIVCGSNAVACCALDRRKEVCQTQEFLMPALTHPELLGTFEERASPIEFAALDKFFEIIGPGDDWTITLAVPSLFLKDSDKNVVRTVTYFLARTGRIRPLFVHIPDVESLVFEPAFDSLGFELEVPAGEWPRAGEIVYQSEVIALAQVLFSKNIRPTDISITAVAAAYLAANKPLYIYLRSAGTPHSSQDIINACQAKSVLSAMLSKNNSALDLNDVKFDMSQVVACTECFSLSVENLQVDGDFRDIALDYSVARKRYSDLGDQQSLKFAVLSVCKKWEDRSLLHVAA
jgi:hypothetical protein